MLRSTDGSWLNYSTTIAFQVAFARTYGTGAEAAAFTAAFVLAIAIGSILSTTAQVIAVPRVLTPTGELRSGAIRFMSAIGAITAVVCLALVILSKTIGHVGSESLGLPGPQTATLLRYAAAFTFLAVIANEISALLLAKGLRLLPSLAPAFPTTLGTIVLAAWPSTRGEGTFLALVCGAGMQAAILFLFLTRERPRFNPDPVASVGGLALATTAQLGLLSLLPVIERLGSGLRNTGGVAQFNYAARSLQGVQQLLIGGLILSKFAEWSVTGNRDGLAQRRSLKLSSAAAVSGPRVGVSSRSRRLLATGLATAVRQGSSNTSFQGRPVLPSNFVRSTTSSSAWPSTGAWWPLRFSSASWRRSSWLAGDSRSAATRARSASRSYRSRPSSSRLPSSARSSIQVCFSVLPGLDWA